MNGSGLFVLALAWDGTCTCMVACPFRRTSPINGTRRFVLSPLPATPTPITTTGITSTHHAFRCRSLHATAAADTHARRMHTHTDDDHDWGWNNGNRRLPGKATYKRMFLDAVGEAQASSRRGDDSGIQVRSGAGAGERGRVGRAGAAGIADAWRRCT